MKSLKQLVAQTPGVRPALARVAVLGWFGAVCTGAQLWLAAYVINAVVFAGARLEAVLPPLVLAALVTAVRAGLLGWRETISSRLGVRATQHWRDALTCTTLTRKALQTPRAEFGATSLIGHGLDKLEGYFARFLPSGVLMAVVPITLLAFAFSVDWLTGLILLLTAPIIPLLMWLIGVAARDHASAQFSAMNRLGARFADALRGFEDLSAMNRLPAQREGLAASGRAWREATLGVLRVAFLNGLALELTATIATAIVAVSSGLRLLLGTLPFEPALLGILIAPEFYAPLRAFGLDHHAGMEAEPVAEALLENGSLAPLAVVGGQQPSNQSCTASPLKGCAERAARDWACPALRGIFQSRTRGDHAAPRAGIADGAGRRVRQREEHAGADAAAIPRTERW